MFRSKASAYDIEYKNAEGVTIYYNYINDGKDLEIVHTSCLEGDFGGDVVIPEEVNYMNRSLKVTSIGKKAFYNCRGLTSVLIPNSVVFIGECAFQNCNNLTYVFSEIDKPYIIDESVFGGLPSNAQLIIPKGTKSTYQSTTGWRNFKIIKVNLEGDVNLDENVNNVDIDVQIAYIMGENSEDLNEYKADVNRDGKINVADVAKIIDIMKDPNLCSPTIIKEMEMLDSEISFVRGVSKYERWTYNLPLAPIKDVIDAKGSCVVKLTITTNPLVGHNGSLYLNDTTHKTPVTFETTPVEGVYVAECTFEVTEEDYNIAVGFGRDYLHIIWQYGNPSDSDACTYTIKSVVAETIIGDPSDSSSIVVNRIAVKKDGTGNFTNIQDAIHSITDASEDNRYEIEIYDDFVSSAFTDLHFIGSPTVSVEGEGSINAMVSYVTTKNWVSLIGKGEKRKIWFINPDIDTPANLFQHIHVMYVQGNGRLENLDIRIKGGRYGIHQDKTGDTSGANPDVNATTEYVDCHIEHFGNDEYTNGNAWGTSAGLAACPSSGGTVKVINSYIAAQTDPLICHLHKNYKRKATYILDGTTVTCKNPNLSLDNIGEYMNDFGTNQNNDLIMVGCNIPHLTGSGKQLNGYDTESAPTDNSCG